MLNGFFLLARRFLSPVILHTPFIQYTATLYNDTTSSLRLPPIVSSILFFSFFFSIFLGPFYYCLLY